MTIDGLTDDDIRALLRRIGRIAVVGASARPERPSHHVTEFLIACGYDVTPVNPGLAGQTLHECRVVGTLAEAAPLQMVDVFRASREAGAIVDDAICLGAEAVWMQIGVIDEAAAARGRAAGLMIVMDRCPAIEAPRLGIFA